MLTHGSRRLPLFPIMLVASATVHGMAFVLLGAVATIPPELLPSHPGFVSVRLVPSMTSEAKDTPEKPVDLVADLPRMDEPIKAQELPETSVPPPPRRAPVERPRTDDDPAPRLTALTRIVTPAEIPELLLDVLPVLDTQSPPVKRLTPIIQAMDRPRNPIDPTPKFAIDTKIITPAEVPDLSADLVPTLVVPKETAKKTSADPSPIARPTVAKVEPRLEAITKIAKIASVSSPASQEVQGTVDELPTKLPFNPPPPYPKSALDAGQEGNVTLRVSISVEGRVTAISVYSSSEVQALDDAALTTVRRWQFTPARRGTTAVPYEVVVPVEFSIRRK